MNKPRNWENTQAYGDYEPLELGGHICKIIKIKEAKSRADKDMIVIYLDIASGPQAGYFTKQYAQDTREDKKWPNSGIVYQLIEDKDGNASRGFKTFIDAVEKSNQGFNQDEIWDENFEAHFKDKLVGGVFRREQYKNQNNELKWSTKCMGFRDIEAIENGVEVPADKYLEETKAPSGFTAGNYDDDLPF